MPKYRISLLKAISFTVEVEADDEEAALEKGFENAPNICAQCSGWGQDYGVDDGADWLTIEEFNGDDYDSKIHGLTVEPA